MPWHCHGTTRGIPWDPHGIPLRGIGFHGTPRGVPGMPWVVPWRTPLQPPLGPRETPRHAMATPTTPQCPWHEGLRLCFYCWEDPASGNTHCCERDPCCCSRHVTGQYSRTRDETCVRVRRGVREQPDAEELRCLSRLTHRGVSQTGSAAEWCAYPGGELGGGIDLPLSRYAVFKQTAVPSCSGLKPEFNPKTRGARYFAKGVVF